MNDHVLITGGSRGIGAATVLEFARTGYDVAFTWNSREDAALDVVQQAQALNPGGRFVALHADVSDSRPGECRGTGSTAAVRQPAGADVLCGDCPAKALH